DESFDFSDLELPEYGEEQALADVEPEQVVELAETPQSVEPSQDTQAEDISAAVDRLDSADALEAETLADESFDFNDLELPEYGEEQALADVEPEQVAELAETPQSVEPNQDTQAEDASAVANRLDSADAPEVEAETLVDESFDFSDLELPEYGEEQALADFATEPSYEPQQEESLTTDDEDSAGDEAFDFSDVELPEYGEEQALADFSQPVNQQIEDDQSTSLDNTSTPIGDELPSEQNASDVVTQEAEALVEDRFLDEALDERDVLSNLFGADNYSESVAEDESKLEDDYDEKTLNELLAEGTESYSPISNVDRDVSDSAGLDLQAMLDVGGEDWNGFSLSPEQQATISDEIPDDERQIWAGDNQPAQAKVQNEDWESQEDLTDFNPHDHQYRTIDELMAEVERQEAGFDPDAEELKLDVGLADFPDVIGDMSDIDVDSNSEAAGKLDLAKIYMEMNDASGAVRLLEEAIVDGNDEIRREAKRLIDTLNSRA
ncbi:MAG TPA: AAA family ATPase, partial [Vibrio sp.]|nr:AAA family ATPase [Vibrio sp.]